MEEDERLQVAEMRKCVDCQRSFEIRKGEKAFYESKGLLLPKRCPTCRLSRRTSIKTTMQIPIIDNATPVEPSK